MVLFEEVKYFRRKNNLFGKERPIRTKLMIAAENKRGLRKGSFGKKGELYQQSSNLKRRGFAFEKGVLLGKDLLERKEEFHFEKKPTIRTTEFEFEKAEVCFGKGSLIRKGSFGKKRRISF